METQINDLTETSPDERFVERRHVESAARINPEAGKRSILFSRPDVLEMVNHLQCIAARIGRRIQVLRHSMEIQQISPDRCRGRSQ